MPVAKATGLGQKCPAVPFDQARADHPAERGANRQKDPERHQLVSPHQLERQEDDRAEDRTEEQRQQHTLPAEERADHRHHLDVTTAHALLFA